MPRQARIVIPNTAHHITQRGNYHHIETTKKNGPIIGVKNKFKRTGKYFVYILQCSDGTYYTGYTPDLERRIKLHNSGKGARYTRDRRPVSLVKEYKYFKRAFLEEKRIKRLTRKQKEQLVYGKNKSCDRPRQGCPEF